MPKPKSQMGLFSWSDVDVALARLCALDAARQASEARMNERLATMKLSHRLEMEQIAQLMSDCLLKGAKVGDEVRKLRGRFQKVCYSFDDAASS